MSATANNPSPQAPKTCGLAIASLVCGLVGPCTLGLASIAGIILGIVGLKKIKAGGGAVGGRGWAIAGIIVSVVTLIIGLILAVLIGGAWLFASKGIDAIQEIEATTQKIEGRSDRAKISGVRADIANIEVAIEAFEVDCGRFPSTQEGINALVNEPSGLTGWHGPYLRRGVPKDAWGNAYMYRFPGQHNTNGYDLYSFGPDGQEGGADDIDNWSQR